MKRFLFPFLFFLLPLSLIYAQNEEDYLQDNKVWSIMLKAWNIKPYYLRTEQFEIKGEVEIGGRIWKKWYQIDPFITEEQNILRQDGKKVYRTVNPTNNFLLSMFDSTLLLYDFGLAKGDTAFILGIEYIVVDSVYDSVFITGQPARKCFCVRLLGRTSGKFYDSELTDVWVEGIGSLRFGFLSSGLTMTGDQTLLCVSQDDELLYQNRKYNSCNVSFVNIEEPEESFLYLYPNPNNGNFKVEVNRPCSVEIYTETGVLVESRKLDAGTHNFSLGTGKNAVGRAAGGTGKAAGLYILKATTADGQMLTRKIAIQ